MNLILNSARYLLTIFVGFTMLCFIIYLAVQQTLRQTANDPQIQMAEDMATLLVKGQTPVALKDQGPMTNKIDMAESLAPFVISFNEEGKPIASNVQLDGKTPVPPAGVFSHARTRGHNWVMRESHARLQVTWQPRAGVRNATIIIHHAGPSPGFVLTGRSLREVEARVSAIGRLIAAAWLVSLCVMLVASLALSFLSRLPQST